MKKPYTKKKLIDKAVLYYRLTKPGVLYGNILTAVAGFLLASKGNIDIWLFISTILGTSLVIASACVINNYYDRDIDSVMARTKTRPIAAGLVSNRGAVIFGIVLGIIGAAILALYTSWLVLAIGAMGFFVYVYLYGKWSKRQSIHGTLVGSISGAAPILAGYVAVSGQFDLGALLVFAILFFWQMPEFYSIAIYRLKEYKAAKVPIITVVKGIAHTKKQIFFYTVLYSLSVLALSVYGYTGLTYLAVMLLLCGYWIWLAASGFRVANNNKWARRMFRLSLVNLLVFCLMISIDIFLP